MSVRSISHAISAVNLASEERRGGLASPAPLVASFVIHSRKLSSTGAPRPSATARHENATHYQGFALQPLVVIAQFAALQGLDLYGYKSHGRSLRDAVVFFGRAMDDPGLVKQYTEEDQKAEFSAADFSEFAFYAARFGTGGLPPALVKGLQRPVSETRIGGSTTLLAGK